MIITLTITVDNIMLTIAVIAFVWCLSFISAMILMFSDADYKTKNSYSIMVLGVIVLVLMGYCTYLLFV